MFQLGNEQGREFPQRTKAEADWWGGKCLLFFSRLGNEKVEHLPRLIRAGPSMKPTKTVASGSRLDGTSPALDTLPLVLAGLGPALL